MKIAGFLLLLTGWLLVLAAVVLLAAPASLIRFRAGRRRRRDTGIVAGLSRAFASRQGASLMPATVPALSEVGVALCIS
jgi:hypothetical protein